MEVRASTGASPESRRTSGSLRFPGDHRRNPRPHPRQRPVPLPRPGPRPRPRPRPTPRPRPRLGPRPHPPVGLVPNLNLELARAREHAHDLEAARDLEHVPALARDLVRAFDRAHDLAGALDRALYRSRALNREGALALNRERASNIVLEIGRGLEIARGLDRDRALDFIRDLARKIESARSPHGRLSRILNPGRDRYLILALALDPTLGRYLTEAHDNLTDAASNFVGADLTAVDPSKANLAGIRWDGDTRWPTPEWTARIRRASVEDAPGSGVFIVLPEEGHNFADRGPVAPIS